MGRAALLTHVHETLTHAARAVVVAGRAGSGRAQLPLEYAYRYSSHYAGVFWLPAARPEQLRLAAHTRALAAALGQPHLTEPGRSLEALRSALESGPAYLLIFEHVEKESGLAALLPQSGAARSLVLTNDPDLALPTAARLELPAFNRNEGRQLLEQLTGAPDAAHERVAETLGGLPFALVQAAAVMRRSRCDGAAYLERFAAMQADLRAHPERLGYETSAAVSFSLNCTAHHTPQLAELLQLLAQLAPEPLALSDLESAGADWEALGRSALVELDVPAGRLCMHPLAQSVLRRALPEQEQVAALDGAAKVIAQALLALSRAPERMPLRAEALARLLPHAQHVEERAAARTHASSALTALCYAAGRVLAAQSEGALAEAWLQRAVCYARSSGPDVSLLTASLAELAGLLACTGRAAQAEPLLREALGLVPDEDDPHRHASLANNLGQLLMELERPAEAEPVLRGALALEPDSPELLNNFARLLKDARRTPEAETLYRRALDLSLQGLPLDEALCAALLNNLASLLHGSGRLFEAQALYRRALAAGGERLGPEHPQLIVWLNNLASLCQDLGQAREAQALYQRALRSAERHLSPDHAMRATLTSNLASTHQDAGHLREAEALYRDALESADRSLGPEHPTTAVRLANLGSVLHALGRLDEAEPLLRRALAITERVRGTDHPELATQLSNLGTLLHSRGRLQEAAELFQRAVALLERNPGHPHASVARANLAKVRKASE